MAILIAMALIGVIFGQYWLVTISAFIWTLAYLISFIKGVVNILNPGISRIGTLICGVKAAIGIYIFICAFT